MVSRGKFERKLILGINTWGRIYNRLKVLKIALYSILVGVGTHFYCACKIGLAKLQKPSKGVSHQKITQ